MSWWQQDIILLNSSQFPDLLDLNIGFAPTVVIVDNYTSYWLYLPDGKAYIPPNWYQAARPLFHANSARVQAQYPVITNTGIKRPTTLNPAAINQFCTVTFTDQPIPYIPGYPAPSPTTVIQTPGSSFGGQIIPPGLISTPWNLNSILANGPTVVTIGSDVTNTYGIAIGYNNNVIYGTGQVYGGIQLLPGDKIVMLYDSTYDNLFFVQDSLSGINQNIQWEVSNYPIPAINNI